MARRTRWFATSVVDPELLRDPRWARNPEAGMIHAKEVGTVVTACGRHATTWHKHWTPFEGTSSDRRCKVCAIKVAEEAPRVSDHFPVRVGADDPCEIGSAEL